MNDAIFINKLREVRDEITRVNTTAGLTVFNPAATELLDEVITAVEIPPGNAGDDNVMDGVQGLSKEEWRVVLNMRYLALASKSDPQGVTCAYCGKPNDWADDCGFFYVIDSVLYESGDKKMRSACKACYDVRIDFNQKIYGVGDR
jgi:hypothetical protein